MASLTAYLSTAGRHARRVTSQRAQAAMLSLALAVSATFPAGIAIAQEADREQEGSAAPEQATPDSTADPDFDPGGETTLPFDVGVGGNGGGDDSGDGAPVDAEPITDPSVPAVPIDDPRALVPDAPDSVEEPVRPAEPAPPAPLPVPAPVPVPAPAPPTSTTPLTDADQQAAGDRRPARGQKRVPTPKRQRDRARQRPATRVAAPTPAQAPAPPQAPTVSPPVATATAEPVQGTATEPGARARAGQRTHTVQRAESLWMIASDLLGPNATNAEIAAESSRLYRLNRDRIGDDPNLLFTGMVLRLR